jgi:hypothetical protein
MNITKTEFLFELTQVKDHVSQELEQRNSGVEGVGTISQLTYVLDELADLEIKVQHEEVPLSLGELGSAYLAMDSWPIGNVLTEELARLDFICTETTIVADDEHENSDDTP